MCKEVGARSEKLSQMDWAFTMSQMPDTSS